MLVTNGQQYNTEDIQHYHFYVGFRFRFCISWLAIINSIMIFMLLFHVNPNIYTHEKEERKKQQNRSRALRPVIGKLLNVLQCDCISDVINES